MDRSLHKSSILKGWDLNGRGLVPSSVASQRIHTMAAGETGEQTISRPVASRKNMRKKLLKILKLVESQEKLTRKDAEASRVSFIYIVEMGGLILN